MADEQKKPEGSAADATTGDFLMHKGNEQYTPEDLQHLSDLEHVRERPSMYIGDTTVRGLHHLVYEVVDNSIDEAMAGYAQSVQVRTTAVEFPSSGTSS